MKEKINSGGNQETKTNDLRTEEAESQRQRNQEKKVGGSNRKGRKKKQMK